MTASLVTTEEGIGSACVSLTLGRLPWRTLGLDKLGDDAGERLWYAMSTGWHAPGRRDAADASTPPTAPPNVS